MVCYFPLGTSMLTSCAMFCLVESIPLNHTAQKKTGTCCQFHGVELPTTNRNNIVSILIWTSNLAGTVSYKKKQQSKTLNTKEGKSDSRSKRWPTYRNITQKATSSVAIGTTESGNGSFSVSF